MVIYAALPTVLRLAPPPYYWRLDLDPRNFQSTHISSAIQTPPRFRSALPVTISMGSAENLEHRIPADAWRILKSLAAEWNDIADTNAVQVIPLKGAMTNEVYQIKWLTNSDGGGDASLSRSRKTLTAADLCDHEISSLIASKMKDFHDLDMPGKKTVPLWERLRNWLNEAKRLSSPKEADAFRLDVMGDEISALEKGLSTDSQPIGLCHNDLQYGNIMMGEETRSITIIDYEYASYNCVAFDIANHFCEMAADYHTETPHILDYNKYPGLEERKRFLWKYLSCSDKQHSESEMEQFMQEVEKYTLASHLFWGLWGIISEHVNKIDFDYIEYARQRFDQYWTNKPELLEQ